MPNTPILGLPYPAPGDIPDGPTQIKALAEAVEAHGAFIVGEVRHIAVMAAPSGWLPADGTAKSRAAFSKLFAAIGTLFGAGDGSTTFTLPDLRGRTLVASGPGPGLTDRVAGVPFGAEVLTVAQLAQHNHGGATGAGTTGNDAPDHTHIAALGDFLYVTSPGGTGTAAGSNLGSYHTTGGASTRHAHSVPALSIPNQGGGGAHWQPSLPIPAYIYAGQ